MINLGFSANRNRLKAKLSMVKTDVNSKAIPRALNKLITQAGNQAAREIRKAGYGFKIRDIKARMKIKRATEGNPVASIRVYHRAVPLIEFSARQTKQGVTVNVKNGRKLVKGAFIATMPTGHQGVYIRVGNTHKKVNKSRGPIWQGLPIKQLYGPSVAVSFANDTVMTVLQRFIKDKWPQLLRHEIEYLSSSWGR